MSKRFLFLNLLLSVIAGILIGIGLFYAPSHNIFGSILISFSAGLGVATVSILAFEKA
jgi:hypothetical protein